VHRRSFVAEELRSFEVVEHHSSIRVVPCLGWARRNSAEVEACQRLEHRILGYMLVVERRNLATTGRRSLVARGPRSLAVGERCSLLVGELRSLVVGERRSLAVEERRSFVAGEPHLH